MNAKPDAIGAALVSAAMGETLVNTDEKEELLDTQHKIIEKTAHTEELATLEVIPEHRYDPSGFIL